MPIEKSIDTGKPNPAVIREPLLLYSPKKATQDSSLPKLNALPLAHARVTNTGRVLNSIDVSVVHDEQSSALHRLALSSDPHTSPIHNIRSPEKVREKLYF